jgi:predicted dienelactone hydrolase
MRPVEIALVAVVLVGIVGWMIQARWSRARPLLLVIALVLACHLAIEGPRLPLAVAYLAAVLLIARALRSPAPAGDSEAPRGSALAAVGRWTVGLIGIALIVAPPWLLPVFRLPRPTGPFAVGGTSFAVVDSSRRDELAPDGPGAVRAFPVRVWYPAPAGTTGRLTRYAATAEVASPLVKILPPVLVHQYRYVRTHTVADAPIATAPTPFPVLVFSHGYTGYSAQNTPQMEELASRGYVVFSIAHSHDASAAVFPDGRVIPLDPGIIKLMAGAITNQDSARAAVQSKLTALARAGTPADRQARFHDYMTSNPPRITQSYPIWAQDTRFLLDYLGRLPAGGGPAARFAGKLDLDRVGIFGMSFGGSNAGEVCRADRRCKAGINIDGQQFGPLIDDSLMVPFMIIASETAEPLHVAILDRMKGPGYLLRLKGTQHVGLTDLPYLAPLLFSRLGLTGTMPVARSEQVLSDYIGAFFDTYLRNQPSALLTNLTPAPDLELRVAAR